MHCVYHYTTFSNAKKILTSGKLISVSYTKDLHELKEYAKRVDTKTKTKDIVDNANIYFESAYNKFYKDLVGKPYWGNYGIYSTPLNLWVPGMKDVLPVRFKIPYSEILNNISILQVGKKRKLINSVEEIILESKRFTNHLIKTLWNKSDSLKFRYLPQIVTFSDCIKTSSINLETMQKNY